MDLWRGCDGKSQGREQPGSGAVRRQEARLIRARELRGARWGFAELIGENGDQVRDAKGLLNRSSADLGQLFGDRRRGQFSAHKEEEGLVASGSAISHGRVQTET